MYSLRMTLALGLPRLFVYNRVLTLLIRVRLEVCRWLPI